VLKLTLNADSCDWQFITSPEPATGGMDSDCETHHDGFGDIGIGGDVLF
jgi:hypothetical protein